jgi:predicted methyltransferase
VAKDYAIAQLWIGGALTYMEQLCAVSFRDAGHHVKMYTYGEVGNIPDGIEICDANEIMPMDTVIAHKRTGSPAPQADKWRYNMLAKTDDQIWADTDAYCVKAFATPNGHFHGWESQHHINNGVVGLPSDSETLAGLIDFTSDEYAIPDWFNEDLKEEMRQKKAAGNPVHVGEQSWGVWGPQALTHFLHKTGEHKYAMPVDALFPVSFKKRRMMLKPNTDLSNYITDNTLSIHFWGRRMRMRIIEREGGEPHPDSLIGKLIKKHGIVPSDAPMPKSNPHRPAEPTMIPGTAIPVVTNADKAGRGGVNLTDIADELGLDQGSQKHSFTELYHMLLNPMRGRSLHMALLGLGGAQDAGRGESTTAPMWLRYLPKAQITALDEVTYPKTHDPRLSQLQTGFDTRSEIAQTVAGLDKLDLVLDDATHVSHHQQNAFVELFPKLKSGGLYIIEDLRFQPKARESSGFPKTSWLFQGYLRDGGFTHPDPAMQEALNALRVDISGCFIHQAKWHKDKRDQVLVVHKR